MELKIDKGVPMPKPAWGKLSELCKSMEVGDSVFFPGRSSGSLAGSLVRFGYKFAKRTVTENGVKGVRVWRIE